MRERLPAWFKQPASESAVAGMAGLLDGLSLHTICQGAHCPNVGDCFARRTATFLILGDVCTRSCRYCAVTKGQPLSVDAAEPEHLLAAVNELDLRYVVITSVTRDDLPDGGAAHFAKVIEVLHRERPNTLVEVLVPDFGGATEALRLLVTARPEVINHNLETVPRLYPEVRPEADYRRSLKLLAGVKEQAGGIVTKSGLMIGMGETAAEVIAVMQDLRDSGCDLLTLGQYLPPSSRHHPLARYVPPEEFGKLEKVGKALGFSAVTAAPLVRSSFRAAELYAEAIKT